MPDNLTIAWVVGTDGPNYFSPLEDALNREGIKVDWYQEAHSANSVLTSKMYPLIIMDPKFPSGGGVEDPEIKAIIEANPTNPYPEIALHTVKKIHADDSVNKETTTLIATVYHPSIDKAFPNAKERLLEAGATEYLWLKSMMGMGVNMSELFVEKVKSLLQ